MFTQILLLKFRRLKFFRTKPLKFQHQRVQDCLEKAHALLLICTSGFDISSLPKAAQHQFVVLLKDLVELALGHYLIFQEECECDEWEYDS